MKGLLTTGQPGVYVEEREDGEGYAVLVNRAVSRFECGAVYALEEVATFPTLSAALTGCDGEPRAFVPGMMMARAGVGRLEVGEASF
jgi:hypothetical protein